MEDPSRFHKFRKKKLFRNNNKKKNKKKNRKSSPTSATSPSSRLTIAQTTDYTYDDDGSITDDKTIVELYRNIKSDIQKELYRGDRYDRHNTNRPSHVRKCGNTNGLYPVSFYEKNHKDYEPYPFESSEKYRHVPRKNSFRKSRSNYRHYSSTKFADDATTTATDSDITFIYLSPKHKRKQDRVYIDSRYDPPKCKQRSEPFRKRSSTNSSQKKTNGSSKYSTKKKGTNGNGNGNGKDKLLDIQLPTLPTVSAKHDDEEERNHVMFPNAKKKGDVREPETWCFRCLRKVKPKAMATCTTPYYQKFIVYFCSCWIPPLKVRNVVYVCPYCCTVLSPNPFAAAFGANSDNHST